MNPKKNKTSLEKSLPFFALFLIFLFIPLIVFAISTGVLTVEGDSLFRNNVQVMGTLSGESDLRIQEGIDFLDSNGNVIYSIYTDNPTLNMVRALTIPSDFNFTYIFQRSSILSPFNISFIFWDSFLERPTLVLNGGVSGRASTFDRSLQVGKNRASGDVNQTYDICEGTTLADCDTLLTGADLVVEDDIEAFGSGQFHENLIVDGNVFVNQIYGSMFQHDLGDTLTLGNTVDFFPIEDMNFGLSNGFELNGTDSLRAGVAGTYLVNWSISFADLANRSFEGGIAIDSIIQPATIAEVKMGTAADQVNFGSPGIISLDVNQLVSLEIRALVSSTTVTIEEASITILRIGS